jgi:hypothetical protein
LLLLLGQSSFTGHCSSSMRRSFSSSTGLCSFTTHRSLLLRVPIAAPPPPVATPPPRAGRCSRSRCLYSMEGMVNAGHRQSSSSPPPCRSRPRCRSSSATSPPHLCSSLPPSRVTATTTDAGAGEEREYINIHIPPSYPGLCISACARCCSRPAALILCMCSTIGGVLEMV